MKHERPRLFTGDPQHENFSRMDTYYPVRELQPAPAALLFPEGAPIELPDRYVFQGSERNTDTFLTETDTVALLVLVDGAIRFEKYYLSGGPRVPWTSWSVAKSFVSALIGIAIEEQLIRSVDDSIDRYLPILKGSAYAGVTIRNVLQMSSGADWN